MFKKLAVLAVLAGLSAVPAATPAMAEFEASLYTGFSFSADSDVTVAGTGSGNDWSQNVSWDGASFEMPPYYGVRGTYWLTNFGLANWGVSLDYVHNKVVADPLPKGVTTLEFTDGLNFVTLNALYRFKNDSAWTPYVGVGGGLSIPHVEYQYGDDKLTDPLTFEYQVAGGVVQGILGVKYAFNDWVGAFAEYRGSYSWNEADLKGGGTLKADVFSNHIAAGLTFSFGGP